MMGELVSFPTDRTDDYRIDFCDPEDHQVSTGRVPPHHLDAEAAVLSALLLDGNDHEDGTECAWSTVEHLLRPKHFYSEANGRIFQAIQHVRIAQTPVDMITVAEWLRERDWLQKMGGTAYLAQLADATPAIGHVGTHAAVIVDLWERRQIVATAQRVAAEGFGDVGDHAVYKASLRLEFGKLTAPRQRLAGRTIGAVVQEARAHVAESVGGRLQGVRYPWAEVADMVGLLAVERQTILAGLSEHGKTAAAMQIAIAVAETAIDALEFGEAVYVVSGEMPGKSLILRTACSFAGVDVLRIEAGRATPDEQQRVADWMAYLARLPIIIDDKPALPGVIAGRVREHQREFAAGAARDSDGNKHPRCRLRLVLGDHLQDLQSLSDKRDEKDRIGDTAHGWLNEIAKGRKVATLLLSQLKTPPPQMKAPKFPPWPAAEDLFGSAKIKACADTAIAVQRPELLMRGAIPSKWIGVAAMCRLKSRFGGEGRRVLLGFDKGVFRDELPAAARGESHYDGDE